MQITELLRKLIAQSESERELGNLDAAKTFAAKAQELLTKHKLDMTEVEMAAEEAAEPIIDECLDADAIIGVPPHARNERWYSILLTTIANSNFCRVITGKSNRFIIVGRESDRLAVKALFIYLAQACNEVARKECTLSHTMRPISIFGCDHRTDSPRGRSAENKKFMSSFKVGFSLAIHARLRAKRAELVSNAKEQGLIRIDQMENTLNREFKQMYPDVYTKTGKITSLNAAGYNAGKRYGSAVGINSTARLGV